MRTRAEHPRGEHPDHRRSFAFATERVSLAESAILLTGSLPGDASATGHFGAEERHLADKTDHGEKNE
jgi:hypothetical protein